MQRTSGILRRFGVLTFLGLGLVSLMIPWPAQARGVQVSIGFGIPLPVAIVPAPAYVQPAPMYVEPAPVYVRPAPVVVTEPYPGQPYYGRYYNRQSWHRYNSQGWHHRVKHWHHYGYGY